MTNESMKSVILKQPFGVGIYTSGMLMSYSSGVVTEEYLHCSNLRWSVNHGVVLVGYGKVEGEKLKGHCKEYLTLVRKSLVRTEDKTIDEEQGLRVRRNFSRNQTRRGRRRK